MLMYSAAVEVCDQEQAVRRGAGVSSLKSGHGDSPVVLRGSTKPGEASVQGGTWHKMQSSQHQTRINLHEIKSQIVTRVGPDKANQYFRHLKRFICCNLNKPQLDKLVISTIGKKNVGLHNQLIRAVLSNAISGDVPPAPPPFAQNISKPVKGIRRKPLVQSAYDGDTMLPNGDVIRKDGHGIVVNIRKPSIPGANVNGEMTLHGAIESGSPDLYRPLQECQSAEELNVDINSKSAMPSVKRLKTLSCSAVTARKRSEDSELYSGDSLGTREERYGKYSLHEGRPVSAPLGLPFCHGSFGSARKPPFIGLPAPLPLTQMLLVAKEEDFLIGSSLPDIEILKNHMDHIAEFENLQGVTGECAEVLYQALDIFLKRLIKSTVDLKGSKSSQEHIQYTSEGNSLVWQNERVKDACFVPIKLNSRLNVTLPNNSFHASGPQIEQKERQNTCPTLSLHDFKVAMELNPLQLGEDWPLQLEKISFQLFDQ